MSARGAVLVTGVSRGIGREIALQLKAAGTEVIGTARRDHDALAKALGVRILPLEATNEGHIESLANAVPALFAVVNNAAIALEGLDAEVAQKTIDVNVHGPRRLVRAVLPKIQPGGRIVNVSSGLGSLWRYSDEKKRAFLDDALTEADIIAWGEAFVQDVAERRHEAAGWPDSAYNVSKTLLNALTRAWAKELEGRVVVNSVCPGWVATDMGGASAPRTPAHGAETPVGLVLREAPDSGGFYRDGKKINW